MVTEGTARLLFTVLLPCSLLSAVLFRYNGLSLVYLTLLLVLPVLPSPSASSLRGATRHFLRGVWCTGLLFLLLQGALQIAFQVTSPHSAVWEEALEHVGIVRLSRADTGNAVRLLAPDIGVTLVGLIVSRLSHRLVRPPGTTASSSPSTEGCEEQEEDGDMKRAEDHESDSEDDGLSSSCSEDSIEPSGSIEECEGNIKTFVLKVSAFTVVLKDIMEPLFSSAGKVLVTVLLGLAAVYFGTFLGLGSWWACRQTVSALAFSSICVFMAIFMAGHLGILYLYQLPFSQRLVSPSDIYARLLGMTAVIRTNDTEPWKLHLHSGLNWSEIINPLTLLLSYYTLVFLLKLWTPCLPKQEEMDLLPSELPSSSDTLGPSSVLYTSGSEDQVTLPHRSWQDLPLLRYPGHHEYTVGLDSPAFGGSEKREAPSGHTTTTTEPEDRSPEPSPFSVLGNLALRHSYITALITMMVWSITYNSWVSFVLLLWACVIWMARDRRALALFSAPGLVLYANLLLLLSFCVGLRLSQEELFPGVPGWLLTDLDLQPYPQPGLHLAIKSFYAVSLWLLLRQRVLERQVQAQAEADAQREDSGASHEPSRPPGVLVGVLGSFARSLLVKYWIYICAAMFFIVSFDGKVVVYKIVYVFLFLCWLALYQVHYPTWRRFLKYFWMVVVSYSMMVLIAVYTYQFQTVSAFFNQTLGFSEEGLRDVGLEQFDTTELFSRILLPTAFLLACILQLHYFNEDFLKTTSVHVTSAKFRGASDSNTEAGDKQLLVHLLKDTIQKLQKILGLNRGKAAMRKLADEAGRGVEAEEQEWKPSEDGGTGDWDVISDKAVAGFLKLLEMGTGMQVFLWRVLEIHAVTLVASVVIWLMLQEVSLMNSIFYISWVAALPYAKLRTHARRVCTLWACVVVVCKMMYQLKCVKPSVYSSNCSEVWQENSTHPSAELLATSVLYLQPVDPAEWLGALRKCQDRVLPCLQRQLTILALMTLEVTVRRHQRFHRLQNLLPDPPMDNLTDTITRAHLDDGLLTAFLYFVNYGFYKFGLELCLVAALNAIGQRMDFYSLIHVSWLIYLLNLRRRKAIAEVWPRYCGFLVSLLIFQYLLCLGVPPAFCEDYPWRTTGTEIHSNLIKWLYLPDFAKKPDANLLLYDFLLLLMASLQWQVFVDENKALVRMQAGDNVEISRALRPEDLPQLSPVPNFIFYRSYLDMVKVVVFRYHYWFVLCLVFLTGTMRINILGAGYLVAFGYLMLHGRHLLLKPVKFILRPWDRLIAFSLLVVATKTLLSVGACVYLDTLLGSHCWLVHTLGMFCTGRGYQLTIPEDESCEPPEKEAGILWDTLCFTFLLVQRRIFLSYYHLHVVADLKAAEALAPRAAQLLELSLRKALQRCEEEEEKSRLATMKQIEKIRTKQREMAVLRRAGGSCGDLAASKSCLPGEGTSRGAPDRDPFGTVETEAEKKWWQPWVTQPSMPTDSSYSLFETDSEEEESVEEGKEEREDHMAKTKTAFQLAYDAWTNSSKSALRLRRQDEGAMERGGERSTAGKAEAETEEGTSEGPDSPIQRLTAAVQLLWVLGKVLLDDVTEAVVTLSGEHVNMVATLRAERHAWWQRVVTEGTQVPAEHTLRSCLSPQATCARDTEEPEPCLGSKAPLRKEVDAPEDARRTGHSRRTPPLLRICRDEELAQSDRFSEHLPRLLKLALAVYQLAESRSEMLCYFVIVLNHTLSASISSMVLPILSFLWAMLSVPRPSKRFWMAAIYYTEVTIVVKYLSQFGFLPWTTKRYTGVNGEKPFSLPNLLGVEKKDGFVLCDLLQLAVLFFHLSTLKDLGLWDQPLSGQTQGQEEKSRKPRRKANQDPEGGDTPGRQAEVGPYFQPPPLGQPGRHWAFWRGRCGGGPQDPGSRKRWRLLRKLPFSQKQLGERMLKKQLKKARKLVIKRSLQIYQSVRQFFYNLTHPEASPVCDVYALTFLVEVLNFAIVLFGYWAFGKYSAADLAESLAEDKVPEAFLAMVLLQFGTMVVDRALYLRKTLFGKCVFQVLLVFGVHFWLFFILPRVTERRFNLNYVAQLWYLVKCIYFGLSAYQIKCGYPNRILGNFLTKNFSLLNFILFKGFRFVPFLLELRAVVDWIWTDTALSLSSWVCLEGLYADIFIMKCWRESEKKYPQPPGQKKKEVVKYGVGGVIAFALVFLMWFPLVFMSLLKTVGGVTNQPLDVSVKIAINGYETLFSMSSQQQNLVPFSEAAYDQLTQQYALHPSAMQFLVNYRPEDIVLAKIKSHASLLWNISPANRAAMAKELANATTIYITVSWTIQRNVSLVKNVEASGKHTVFYTDQDTRSQLLRVLTGTREEPILLPALIPKALRTTAGTEAKMALRLDVAHSQRPQDLDRLAFFRTALLRLQQLRPSNTPADGPVAEWWVVQEWRPACNQSRGCGQDLELVVYNDKVSPQSLNFLAGYGIVGLYVSVVMVAAKFIREHFHSVSRSIMFDELPSVDRVLTLCTDIFLVRELGALELEQRLFNKLVFLYRSPETMIKWTRPASPRRPRPDPVAGAAEDSGEGP